MKLEIVFDELYKMYGNNFLKGTSNVSELNITILKNEKEKEITINNYDKLTEEDILIMIEKLYNS